MDLINGFSRLSMEEKIRVASEFAVHPVEFAREMFANQITGHKSGEQQTGFTENALSGFCLPYSVAPNFLINGKHFMVPMVTEESSVIAAASSAAKFWFTHGGFTAVIHDTIKPGHIHFLWKGSNRVIMSFFDEIKDSLTESVSDIVKSMKSRGGGITGMQLKNFNDRLEGYYQLEILFHTADAMGANFINTCLESIAENMIKRAEDKGISGDLEIIMSILSNYTSQCLVNCSVNCHIRDLEQPGTGMSGEDFARRFLMAVNMANVDISRAVTHNKGIYNGVDAVLIATGNDFRAAEAAGHSWASRGGSYQSLSGVKTDNGRFELQMEIPLAAGVVGGSTRVHPMSKASLQLLGDPDAPTLMAIAASVGLANHFSALRALVTDGIQKGHMKLHLNKILVHLKAGENERKAALRYFSNRNVSFNLVKEFLLALRQNQNP